MADVVRATMDELTLAALDAQVELAAVTEIDLWRDLLLRNMLKFLR